MKIEKLIKRLQELDPETEVVMSKDAEGNEFSPLCDFSDGFYISDNSWSGHFISDVEEWEEYYEQEFPKDAKKAICLWPIN